MKSRRRRVRKGGPENRVEAQCLVGHAHAVYEQIYCSSLMPRTYLCARLLETLD